MTHVEPRREPSPWSLRARGAARVRRRLRHAVRALLRVGRYHSRYAETPFGKLHYFDSAPDSDEPAALLVHGMGASSLFLLPIASLVRMHRRVVLPDLFHFAGLSEATVRPLDTGQHVEALAALVRALGCGPVDLVGHSMGGGLSIYLALRFPELVATATLLNPGGFTHGYAELADDLRNIDAVRVKRLYERAFAPTRLSRLPPFRSVGERAFLDALSRPAIREYMETIRDDEWLDAQVHRVACPTLLLWGEHDRFLSRDIAEHVTRSVPDVEAYWLDQCSHMIALEAPYAIYRIVLDFWARRGRTGATIPPWLAAVLPTPSPRSITPTER